MNMREIGRERGREAAGKMREQNLPEAMQRTFEMNLDLYPTVGKDYDMAAAVLAHDKRRIACTPDYTKFPEMRGLADRVRGEREGFIESSGFTELHAAFHYSWWHFMCKYLNCHHLARYDLVTTPSQCTNVFFPEGKDGVIVSDNRDDVPRPWYQHVPHYYVGKLPADAKINWLQGGVSSAVLLDEEPEAIFPYNPHEWVPEECLDDIRALVQFMDGRRDFWGPGNQLWVDRKMDAVAVEKANVRAAYRYPTSGGAACITACSYLDPELSNFKRSRLLEAAKQKGEAEENNIDIIFSDGCDLRHQRLWDLMNAEAARPGGATLWGAFNCVADTDVPFPARVCLAGEKTDPAREPEANWTLSQHAIVMTGPNRRALYRSVQDMAKPRPIYEETPKFKLGEGVAMQPEWQKDIDEGRCILAD